MTQTGFNQTIIDQEIKMSAAAAEQMKALMASAEGGVEGIRVFVTGGGCGGMTYGMTYAEATHPYDKVLEGEGFKLMADAIAVSYLKGCDIDYVENGLNSSFVFNNVFQSVGGSGVCGGCGAAGGGCG
ncbi:MAG: iron-sulfur cluster assembly accessory protein [Gammaproteobacteria bacterium]|nr:iron-sulfur cluster assembly accessory protein [Gammaproteobacteria bacterium]MDH5777495.1 iron-sulfur cluster assembly accessory protein [Gammaproteobacteria bacterium]